MNGLIRRRYLFEKITELEKETKDRIRKVHLGSAEYQRYMEQLNERSLMKKMILTAPAVPDINVGGKRSGEKRRCDMERLTKRIEDHVYYTKGKYEETLSVEMETKDVRKVLKKLAYYEDLEEKISNKFADCISIHAILDSFCNFYDMQESKEEIAQCILLTNEDAIKYRQWKDAEEQRLLLRLPVPEGAVVYTLSYIYECKFDYDCKEFDAYKCEEDIPCKHQYKVYRVKETKFQKQMLAMLGKTVFLTKEEAEQALAKMKEA